MEHQRKILFSNFKSENWRNLILFAVACFYFVYFGVSVFNGSFLSTYGGDYLAFWSVGKIADGKGYSEIYNLNNLRNVQTTELKLLGFPVKTDDSSIPVLPAAILSFFVIPFQLLSKVDLQPSYWIWTSINLAILIGYLVFFLRKIQPEDFSISTYKKLLFLMLLSFPVFKNLVEGQVQVLLVISGGEFIRYSLNKKPLLSGLWLGGLLLKPQVLIVIIPVLLLLRNWKTIMGFMASSSVILMTSFTLSGMVGMKSLIDLWTRYSVGIATSSPEAMINWRMVGVNLNLLLNISIGWVITGLGIVLTFLAVYFLIKHNPPYGSPQWVMVMLGVFSATLAITWHAHYHMAMILIPFLIYVTLHELLPKKMIFLWVIVTPIAWFVMGLVGLLVLFLTKNNINNFQGMLIAFSGFILNLVILIATMKFSFSKPLEELPI